MCQSKYLRLSSLAPKRARKSFALGFVLDSEQQGGENHYLSIKLNVESGVLTTRRGEIAVVSLNLG